MNWTIEPLAGSHARKAFSCGRDELDDYLRKYAGRHTDKNVGRTFVAVRPGGRAVLGYYTLSASSVAFANAPERIRRRLPRYPLPVALVGKLAVDASVQGQGLGECLLVDALRRVVRIADEIAVFGVEVHALDAAAQAFYAQYGFEPFLDQPLHLFLPLDTIRALF